MQMSGSTVNDARKALIIATDRVRRKCGGGADAAGTLGLVRSDPDTIGAAAIFRRMGADNMPGTWPGSTLYRE